MEKEAPGAFFAQEGILAGVREGGTEGNARLDSLNRHADAVFP